MEQITFTQPDDWHIHLRDGFYLKTTVVDASRQFCRAIVMPNLTPPVTSVESARAYRQRICSLIPAPATFTPLMTLYLTDQTTPEIIQDAKQSEIIFACKLYPAGSTTHSHAGVRSIENIYPALKTMEALHMPLLIHGETADPNTDIFDREEIFLNEHLAPLITRFSKLRIVLEHISTEAAVRFIETAPEHVGATITAHHLMMNRNDMLVGSIKPHHFCLPILKRRRDQEALIEAATGGNQKFFLGTDSAPHAQSNKETAYGCAGIYTAFAAIELYAEIFEQANALTKLEAFASHHGADFYGLPRNKRQITLYRQPWTVPNFVDFGRDRLIPFRAEQKIQWRRSNA